MAYLEQKLLPKSKGDYTVNSFRLPMNPNGNTQLAVVYLAQPILGVVRILMTIKLASLRTLNLCEATTLPITLSTP